MPSSASPQILIAAIAGAVAAITLVYIFGPTLFPGDDADGAVDSSSSSSPRDEINRSKARASAVGLVNPANDCFINSVLQALAGLKELKRFLSTESTRRQVVNGEEKEKDTATDVLDLGALSRQEGLELGIVTRALEVVLGSLSQPVTYRKTISTKGFVRTLEYAYGRLINRRQQDAQEFLQVVVERLADEYQSIKRTAKDDGALDDRQHRSDGTEDTPGLFTPFQGCTTSQIECHTCHHKPTPTDNSFAMLSLSVAQTSSTTLDACLDGLLKLEIIDGYRCDHCALSRPKTAPTGRIGRHTYISKYPEILILHLSRSVFDISSTSLKNNAKVVFPEILTLGGFEPRRYRLACLITHRGGHDSGHYETFRRKGGEREEKDTIQPPEKKKIRKDRDKWWRISDERIAECTTEDVLDMQKEAYLLFYEFVH